MDFNNIEIEYESGYKEEINTFEGFLKKDLVMDGTIQISFWLSKVEQESILYVVQKIHFFEFPDTLSRRGEYAVIRPDPGPQKLRIKCGNQEKTVIWFPPINPKSEFSVPLQKLIDKIWEVINANPRYQKLPSARGGYG